MMLLIVFIPVFLLFMCNRKFSSKNLKILTVAGSGGHTNELVRLMSSLFEENSKFRASETEINILIAETDKHSLSKIQELHLQNHTKVKMVFIQYK